MNPSTNIVQEETPSQQMTTIPPVQEVDMERMTKKRLYDGNDEFDSKKYRKPPEISPDEETEIPLDCNLLDVNSDCFMTSDLIDGCNIVQDSKCTITNGKKIELNDFLFDNKLSSNFLIYKICDRTINAVAMDTIKKSVYKIFFVAEQDQERREDTSNAWYGPIYPDKNSNEHEIVIDSKATCFSNAKRMVFTLETLNNTSMKGLGSLQVFLVRTDLLEGCKKENKNEIRDICDETGYGALRVSLFDNGTVYLKRQPIVYSHVDSTDWTWVRFNWKEDKKQYGMCLPTIVSASIFGIAPANPIKDPCTAMFTKNDVRLECAIEISLSGKLRAGKIIKNDDEKVTRTKYDDEEKIELLKTYKEKNGNFRIVQRKNRTLYDVVHNFKKMHRNGTLSKDTEKKLNDIGFDWDIKEIRGDEEKVQLLKAYKENNGDFKIQRHKNSALYDVAYNFKKMHRNGTLSKDTEKNLNDIGFDWDIMKQRGDEEKVKLLKAYKEKNGDFKMKKRKNEALYKIAHNFKKMHRDGTLLKDTEKKLNDIGFDWDIREIRGNEEKIELLKTYKEKNGNFKIVQRKNQSLYKIAHNFKKMHRNGTLSKDTEKKLNDIGFDWDIKEIRGDEEKVELLKAYKENNGDFKIKRKNEALYQIAHKFKKMHRNGTLSKDTEKKLNDIGFDWNGRKRGKRK